MNETRPEQTLVCEEKKQKKKTHVLAYFSPR